jgi:hypothetical protein
MTCVICVALQDANIRECAFPDERVPRHGDDGRIALHSYDFRVVYLKSERYDCKAETEGVKYRRIELPFTRESPSCSVASFAAGGDGCHAAVGDNGDGFGSVQTLKRSERDEILALSSSSSSTTCRVF